jgi:hypothetical protein
MSNGINYELDFEKRIGDMPDRKLLEFVARQTLEITDKCKVYESKISSLEAGDRRTSGIIGGISGTITAIVVGIINYLVGAGRG